MNKKNENTVKNCSNSTTENSQKQEKILDFRVEIEKRFKQSFSNKIYSFPKNNFENYEDFSSSDSSLNSLKIVTTYNLKSQNAEKREKKKHEKSFTENNSFFQNLLKIKEEKQKGINKEKFIDLEKFKKNVGNLQNNKRTISELNRNKANFNKSDLEAKKMFKTYDNISLLTKNNENANKEHKNQCKKNCSSQENR